MATFSKVVTARGIVELAGKI